MLESPTQGRLLLELEPSDAAQLAETYRVRVGMAESVEVAVLAALVSSPGKVRVVLAEQQEALLYALPLYVLKGLGLSQRALGDLGWLGLSRVGELRAWRRAQAAAYLGRAGKDVLPYLYGPYRSTLSRYCPPPSLSASFAFDEPQNEPCAVQPPLERLCAELAFRLGDRAASRLSVTALSQGLEYRATRIAKVPLKQFPQLIRLALLTLADTQAQPLSIDALSVTLSGLSRPAEQGSLWPRKERVAFAIEVVEARFPGALLHLVQDDPYSLASEHNICLVTRSTGEEVAHEASSPAPERHDRRPRSSVAA